ncbi:hypothetical protein [Paenibacillus polymyxa]|uniref:hypothetical protein n=1 Tax=Paenibacillus polymyxa TaxID=1406 RepID=UPI0020244B80|nr:hypothetical protein [Paenibacillus polymyxa]URJ58979.3 hypothetical protein MF622_003579 [Paenibacillus polymyxa]
MKKKLILSFLLMFNILLFSFNNLIIAQSDESTPDAQIKASIESDFKLKYVDSLNAVKSDYKLKAEENFENAQLSSGTAFYKVTDDVYSSAIDFAGYIFTLKTNDREVATIYASSNTGSWKISSISNRVNSENSLLAAEATLSKNEKVKLIDDERYGLNALLIEGGEKERVIDLSGNGKNVNNIESSSNKTISKSLFDQKIKEMKAERSGPATKDGAVIMGTGQFDFNEPSKASSNVPIILFSLGIISLFPIFIILKKKRNS